MSEFPAVVAGSHLWRSTLAPQPDDRFTRERERLRSSFMSFRERAAQLAEEVRRDLPELTMHDLTHLDALWEVGSLAVGEEYRVTPAEGYVLGGAILLHDLGMSVAAWPGGHEALLTDIRYRDLVFREYQERLGRSPSDDEVLNPDAHIRRRALFELLRQLHAENAEKLAFLSYPFGADAQLFLIDDTELRQTFGRVIGQIAHSHWWAIGELETRFSRVIGAPHWGPSDWTIDPLKVACILRAADAAHLDARRAPIFVKAFSRIGETSEAHWSFQARLNKPYLRDDGLVFTSGASFPLSDANAWWTCLDNLELLDRELRSIDALLSDRGLQRFAARRVAGVDSPERLALYVQTADWLPIDARIHISDLRHIIKTLGGRELYGHNPLVPLRELIQNSSDAVRARRVVEHRALEFGEVRVSLYEENDWFLEVEDNGIGMSQRVLTDFLLDFGRSFWDSLDLQEDFPGLRSSGFQATGKYGIGFFSVFMESSNITVKTRRADAAAKDTLVLSFGSGLSDRPIVRPARKEEQLREGGTIVLLKLSRRPDEEGGLLRGKGDVCAGLAEVCAELAPALDVNLVVREGSSPAELVIRANDWETVSGLELLARLPDRYGASQFSESQRRGFRERASQNLREIRDERGGIRGRACISVGYADHGVGAPDVHGVVTVGGLRASPLSGICGVLVGRSIRAARNVAEPTISKEALSRWAEEQVRLVPNLLADPAAQAACAQNIRLCGGHTGTLPIALNKGSWVSARQIEMMDLADEIVILDLFTYRYDFKYLNDLVLYDHVFVTHHSSYPGMFQGADRFERATFLGDLDNSKTLGGAVVEAASVAWGVPFQAVFNEDDFRRKNSVRVGNHQGALISTVAVRIARPVGASQE